MRLDSDSVIGPERMKIERRHDCCHRRAAGLVPADLQPVFIVADMVLIQRPEWGGGEVWFDGELIRKDGKFLPKDLKPLNPENLK